MQLIYDELRKMEDPEKEAEKGADSTVVEKVNVYDTIINSVNVAAQAKERLWNNALNPNGRH